jgi:hypothetical protein
VPFGEEEEVPLLEVLQKHLGAKQTQWKQHCMVLEVDGEPVHGAPLTLAAWSKAVEDSSWKPVETDLLFCAMK